MTCPASLIPLGRFVRAGLLALALAACGLASAEAAILIGNIPQTNDDLSTNMGPSASKALVFTLGSTAYAVDNVTLRLSNYNTIAGDSVRVGLFLDNGSGTNTGAQVGSFLPGPVSGVDTLGNFTFLPADALTLNANTTYWLRFDSLIGSTVWMASSPALTPTGVDATYVSAHNSVNGGASYSASSLINTFQINATAVPEPGSALLLGTGALGLLGFRRRRS